MTWISYTDLFSSWNEWNQDTGSLMHNAAYQEQTGCNNIWILY